MKEKKLGREIMQVNYHPMIGISPYKGPKLNIWALNFRHEWVAFTYFSPDLTDLAISAVVKN